MKVATLLCVVLASLTPLAPATSAGALARLSHPSLEAAVSKVQEPTAPTKKVSLWQRVRSKYLDVGLVRSEYLDAGLGGLYATITLGAILLVVFLMCGIVDAFGHWRYMRHFLKCRSEMLLVQDSLVKPERGNTLCPICIQKVSKAQKKSQSVVFLCGHRFHTHCANSWYVATKACSRCPICNDDPEGPPACRCCDCKEGRMEEGCSHNKAEAAKAAAKEGCDMLKEGHHGSHDEAKAFFLKSLSLRYPEFITEESIKRWSNCHTEIWLEELDCPRYASLFRKFRA